MHDASRRNEKTISSPTELETGGFIRIHGRILGSGKIGKRPGLIVLGVGSILIAAIVYGVAHRGVHHSFSSDKQPVVAVAAEAIAPWWKDQSDAVRPSSAARAPEATATPVDVPSGVPDLSAVDEAPPVSTGNVPRAQSLRSSSRTPHPVTDFPAIPLLPEPQQFASETADRGAVQDELPAPTPSADESALQVALASHILVGPNESVDSDGLRDMHGNKPNVLGIVPASIDNESRQAVSQGTAPTFTIAAGTVIAAALVTAIDSDLPGLLVAQVRQNAYDSATGRYLLIPQGTKIVGQYDSRITYGQDRLFVSWQRLNFPDGTSVFLNNMAGADTTGRSGFDARVDSHTRKLFQGAILLSIIGAGAQLSQPRQTSTSSSTPSVDQVIAGSVGEQIASVGTQVVQRQLNVPPNLRVPTGYQFNIMVDHDVVFAAPYAGD